MSVYEGFLASKRIEIPPTGFDITSEDIHPVLFPFQRDITAWALRMGKACIFADCGLGKSLMQLEWARHVHDKGGGDILILAPLAVSHQLAREGLKIGLPAKVVRSQKEIQRGINISNYEMLHNFDPDHFSGIVLDESSILKAYDGKTRTNIITSFSRTSYRLACTATPAPNDHMELGNHSEYLGVMTRTEMLSMFFVHDGGETQKWRIKGHAEDKFWEWVASWAVVLRKPSDLGYEDDGFNLPPLNIIEHVIKGCPPPEGMLFATDSMDLHERRKARRSSMRKRVDRCAEIANRNGDMFLAWCDLNDESKMLTGKIGGSVEVKGSDDPDSKASSLLGFSEGSIKKLVSKPFIAGHGMNFQACSDMAFVGLSDSYEQFYQAVRRCWRFGQKKPVNVHIIIGENEQAVLANIKRKQGELEKMQEGMVAHTHKIVQEHLKRTQREESKYTTREESGKKWRFILGDCIDGVKSLAEDSIHYSIFSPPFASLYTYTDSERDMGNCKTHSEFYTHFQFLIGELFRITMPGRLLSFHCMNLPTSKVRDGVIGIEDFRGEMIRLFVAAGWIYHSEVVIWKDPVTAMQRTKALGLLHKQLKKDSCMSRQGIPDYLVTMRKPGENPERVTKTNESFPVSLWQRYASPIWMDIRPSNTLARMEARDYKDEKHICPLQLDVIERAVELWTNPDDLVFSPFAGIGSEGYVAIQKGRRFLGIELKESYWKQGVKNLRESAMTADTGLF